MKLPTFVPLCSALLLGASASFFLSSPPALAAEKIVLKYGPLAQSLQISALENFVKTGETTPTLATIIRFSKQNPQTLRGLMSLELGVNILTLDRLLNSVPGEAALMEVGKTIRTRSGAESYKALRAAFILAATDNKLSALEILKKYPTSEIDVEIGGLGSTFDKLKGFAGNLQNLLKSAADSTPTTATATKLQPTAFIPPRLVPAPMQGASPRSAKGLW